MNGLVLLAGLMALLVGACGGENDDTLWTGLSGVLIFVVLAVIVVRTIRKHKD